MVKIPLGQWAPDLPATDNEGLSYLLNALPEARGYKAFPDLQPDPADANQSPPTISSRCLGLFGATDASRSSFNFASDATTLYHQSADGLWKDSTGSAGPHAVASQEFWDFEKFGDLVIAVAYGEIPQQFDISTPDTVFSNLSATAPQGRHCAVVRDHLVLGNITDSGTDYPYRVAWSPVGAPAGVWTPDVATLAGNQDLGGDGGWVQAVTGGEFGLVFQEWAIWRMTPAPTPTIFQFDEIEKKQGTPAPRSVVKHRHLVYYYGQDGFYVSDGGGPSRPIGRGRVDDFVANDLQANERSTVIGTTDPQDSLIYWAYAGMDSVGGIPNRLICYSPVYDKWGLGDITTEYIGALRSRSLDMDAGINALYPNLDLMPISLDSNLWASQSLVLSGFDSSHRSGTFNGAALPATFETGQHQPTPRRSLVQNFRPILEDESLTSLTCNIAGKTRAHDATVFATVDQAVDSEGDCPTLTAGRYFRFRMAATGDFKHAVGFELTEVVDDGDH